MEVIAVAEAWILPYPFMSFVFSPQPAHILQSLALGFGHETPDKDGSDDTDQTIQTVSEPVAEVVAGSEVHVEHRHERRTHDPVENPLEGNGYGNRLATDRIGEDLSDEHPADGAQLNMKLAL